MKNPLKQDIDAITLKNMILDPKMNVYIIDVRTLSEFLEGHIFSAINIPLDHLNTALVMKDRKFKQIYQVKKPKKKSPIVFNCARGERSARAIEIAKNLGFKNVYHLEQGFPVWVTHILKNA